MSEFASTLDRLMRERDLGPRALGRAVYVSHGHIVNLRSGRDRPSPEMAVKLGLHLGVGTALKDAYERDRAAARAVLGATPDGAGAAAGPEIEERLGYALRHPGRADLVTAAALRQEVQRLDDRYSHVPAAALLADAGQYLGQIRFLAAHAGRSPVQRELRAAEVFAGILMGQLVWDASQRRDYAAARSFLGPAAGTARRVRDPAMEGLALLRTCMTALYGERDPGAGLALAAESARAAGRASEAVTGLALLHEAEAHAMLGDRSSCEAALASAERLLGRVDGLDPAAGLYSEAHLGRMAGSCYLALGDARRAQGLLEATAASLGDGSKSQAIVLANLALAHIRQGSPDTAAGILHQAIDVTEVTWGGGAMNLVFEAGQKLRPWKDVPAVQEVRDRMLALLAR